MTGCNEMYILISIVTDFIYIKRISPNVLPCSSDIFAHTAFCYNAQIYLVCVTFTLSVRIRVVVISVFVGYV
jgi:hypothetical protein